MYFTLAHVLTRNMLELPVYTTVHTMFLFTQVNTNGMVSFIWDTMVLFGIPEANECVIVPFYVDMDTTKNNGRVYYRQTTNPAILRRAKRDVKRSFSGAPTFNPDWVLIASFNRLTYVSGSATSPVSVLIASYNHLTYVSGSTTSPVSVLIASYNHLTYVSGSTTSPVSVLIASYNHLTYVSGSTTSPVSVLIASYNHLTYVSGNTTSPVSVLIASYNHLTLVDNDPRALYMQIRYLGRS